MIQPTVLRRPVVVLSVGWGQRPGRTAGRYAARVHAHDGRQLLVVIQTGYSAASTPSGLSIQDGTPTKERHGGIGEGAIGTVPDTL